MIDIMMLRGLVPVCISYVGTMYANGIYEGPQVTVPLP